LVTSISGLPVHPLGNEISNNELMVGAISLMFARFVVSPLEILFPQKLMEHVCHNYVKTHELYLPFPSFFQSSLVEVLQLHRQISCG
jgi:hypothetical protein